MTTTIGPASGLGRLLFEQGVAPLREALPESYQIDDPDSVAQFLAWVDDPDWDLIDTEQSESGGYAYGYIRGAADMAGVVASSMLAAHGALRRG